MSTKSSSPTRNRNNCDRLVLKPTKEHCKISADSNPHNRSLFLPWLAVSITFAVSLIVAIATMLHGMAQMSVERGNLPWWYHTLMVISEYGLALSSIGILALVIVSIRRASKTP